MAKYYITCGTFEFLTTAEDPHSAALWAIHQFLANRIELETVQWNEPGNIDRQDLMEAMLDLEDTVFVSEIGFGRDDVGLVDTADLLTEWNQLAIAIQRLSSIELTD